MHFAKLMESWACKLTHPGRQQFLRRLPSQLTLGLVAKGMMVAALAVMALKLLLVEDDLSFARSEQTMLETLGYEVVVCSNAKTSVARLLDERFDLIVLDLCLGSSSLAGLAIIQSLRQMRLSVPPIVITSGNDKTLIEWAAAKIQTRYWLQKPFNGEQLANVIEEAASQFGAWRRTDASVSGPARSRP